MAKWRRSSEQRRLLSGRHRAPKGFTSAEGERRLVREQTQMLDCQNSCQGERKLEIEIKCIDPGIVFSETYNKPSLSVSLSLLLIFAMSHSTDHTAVIVMREMSPPNTPFWQIAFRISSDGPSEPHF